MTSMGSKFCSHCCFSYFCCCCPSLRLKERYAGVSYSTIEESMQVVPDDKEWPTNSLVDNKVFSFPQQQTDSLLHPLMFSTELSDPVTEQPTSTNYARRFSTQSSTGTDFELCVAGIDSEVREQLQKHVLSSAVMDSPSRKKSGTFPRSISRKSKSPSAASSLFRQQSLQETVGRPSWVVGLPIVEENSLTGQRNKPMLQFSLYYNIQQSTLMVHLHHASNLPAKDRQGTSDPFVVLYLTPNKEETFQSAIIDKTLNPIFDQSFEFRRLTPDDIHRQTLIFKIYDHDRFSHNDIIGMVALPLENADLYGVVMRMMIQEDQEEQQLRGKVLISLSYDPQLSMLKGIVLKAADLKKQDLVGLADPYIKVHLMYKGKKKKKWKTSVKRNTLTPVFNESFQFEISKEMDMSNVHMELLLMDYDRLSRNDVIGAILLGERVSHVTGRKHWMDMLESPRQSISQWHSVLPLRKGVS